MEYGKKAITLICISIFLSLGCNAAARKNNEGWFGRAVEHSVRRSLGITKDKSPADRLWRAGYGFNNPNPERMRNGQPLLNFDGSVAD